jgi:hypothetical protein
MDWQQSVSLAIVGVAAALLTIGKLRRKNRFDPDTGCGCGGDSRARPPGSIVYRARKGARGEIIVKFK